MASYGIPSSACQRTIPPASAPRCFTTRRLGYIGSWCSVACMHSALIARAILPVPPSRDHRRRRALIELHVELAEQLAYHLVVHPQALSELFRWPVRGLERLGAQPGRDIRIVHRLSDLGVES